MPLKLYWRSLSTGFLITVGFDGGAVKVHGAKGSPPSKFYKVLSLSVEYKIFSI